MFVPLSTLKKNGPTAVSQIIILIKSDYVLPNTICEGDKFCWKVVSECCHFVSCNRPNSVHCMIILLWHVRDEIRSSLLLGFRRHVKISLAIIRFQSNIRNQVKLRKCLLHILHPTQHEFSRTFWLPICTDIDIAILFVIGCPIFDT